LSTWDKSWTLDTRIEQLPLNDLVRKLAETPRILQKRQNQKNINVNNRTQEKEKGKEKRQKVEVEERGRKGKGRKCSSSLQEE
jgi:hypothetical protein